LPIPKDFLTELQTLFSLVWSEKAENQIKKDAFKNLKASFFAQNWVFSDRYLLMELLPTKS